MSQGLETVSLEDTLERKKDGFLLFQYFVCPIDIIPKKPVLADRDNFSNYCPVILDQSYFGDDS